jgi:RNAse (barnase) inhibitor barstar
LARLVHDGAVHGARQLVTAELAGTVTATLEAHGWHTWTLDTSDTPDKAAFLRAAAVAFALPEWFGHNWDALVDALRAVRADTCAAVVWRGAASLAAHDPDAFTTAVEILRDAADANALVVLLVTPTPLPGVAPL